LENAPSRSSNTPDGDLANKERTNESNSSGSENPTPKPTFRWTHPTPRPTIGPSPSPVPTTPADVGQASVYLYPDTFRVVVGESFTAMVMIDATGQAVSSYAITVLYDPTKIRLDGVRPGDDPLLGTPAITYVEKDGEGNPLGVVNLLKVQTDEMNRPIGTRIMIARLDFTSLAPGDVSAEVAQANLANTQQFDMQIRDLGSARISILSPPQP